MLVKHHVNVNRSLNFLNLQHLKNLEKKKCTHNSLIFITKGQMLQHI